MHCGVWSCIVSEAQTWTVGVTGATGYAGGEVCRLLAGHPNLRLAGVHANATAGRRLGELQPHLLPFAELEVRPSDAESLTGYDVVVLALPHGESAAIAAQLPADTLVIDCGADHRLNDPAAWARWYGGEHAGPWPYGLPEPPRQRDQVRGARTTAGPGWCAPRPVPRPPAATRPRSPARGPRPWPRASSSPTSSWSRPPGPAAPASPRSRTCSAARSWARSAPTASAGCTGTPRRWCRTSRRRPGDR